VFRFIFLLSAALIVSSCTTTSGSKGMDIRYGKIETKERVTAKNQQSTLAGFKGIKATSDLPALPQGQVEANVNRALAVETEAYTYLIRFSDGKSLKLTTDKEFFYRKDCVSVERGELINIRLVEDEVCSSEIREQKQRQVGQIQAKQCAMAKRQLMLAQSDRETDRAAEQVRNLCQYSRS